MEVCAMLRASVFVLLCGAIGCVGTVGTDAPQNGARSTGGGNGNGSGGSIAISRGGSTGMASGGSTTTGGNSGATGGTGASSTTASNAYSDIPCNVGKILQTNCSMCHGGSPQFGAPMSLVHASDFAKKAVSGTQTVGQAVLARINDDARPMPPAPNPRLSSADNMTLTAWIQAGAKAATCSSTTAPPDGTAPGAVITTDPSGPGITCYDIKARDSSGNKFSVPNTPNLYHCFNYAPPWGSAKVHLISWRPLIDNSQVIHHWLLYNDTTAVTDKTDADCVGAHPSAQLTAGWAPGGRGYVLPDDVGEDVSGAGFTLETHYNNLGTTNAPDASGIRLCVTTNLRPNEAGISWLGTELILLPVGGTASGLCTPTNTGAVHILTSTPHMHLQGRHMTTIINRAGGTKETLVDQPFDFNSQIGYDTRTTIMPGDTLTTTCTFGGAALYGEGTNNEMCYNFVLAYPNGALSSPSILRKNGCTGL
jgi:cytochrome c5